MKNLLINIKAMYQQGKLKPYVPNESEIKVIKSFYDYLSLESNYQTIEFMDSYLAKGFKIKEEHSLILNKDPFEKICNTIKRGSYLSSVWDKVWNECMDEDYKKKIVKKDFFIESIVSIAACDVEARQIDFHNAYVSDKAMFNFISDNFINIEYIKADSYLRNFKSIKHSKRKYPAMNRLSINICDKFIDVLEKKKIEVIDKNVTFDFNEQQLKSLNNESKNNKVNEERKNISNILKTLKLYEYKFTALDKNEKIVFEKIMDNVEKINSTDYLSKNSDSYAYIERLVYKHMPELLGDFLELPEKIKYSFKDNNGKTPQDLFKDTLITIEEKTNDILHASFSENLTNIKVKNKLMKMN